jgi:hypothetical protein
MRSRDRTHASLTGVARRRALAAGEAHPVAAALAVLTLALAILAAAGSESRDTPRAQTGLVPTQARPEGTVPSAPKLGSVAAHGPQRRPVPTAKHGHRRGAAVHRRRTGRALWPRAALNAAERFLHTYLPFTYGQLPASAIAGATPMLRARIAANPPAVPAAIRRLHPTVTALTIIAARIADAGTGWAATATVSDRRESYQVTVKLGQQHGRWLVTSIVAPSG